MPSGGARSRSGPAPDPNALRRDRKNDVGWTLLPSSYDGDVPDWPLAGGSDRELALWETFWRKPQAVLWTLNGQVYEVAMHVRTFAEAEQPKASTQLRILVRQQADALLLTIPAMFSARVKLASVDELSERKAERKTSARAVSSRARLRAAPKAADG